MCTFLGKRASAIIYFNRIIKNCCETAGFDEKQFGAHSLRSGFLTQETKEKECSEEKKLSG